MQNISSSSHCVCQRTFEDMVTSRQCTGLRKSPHTRRFRREVQGPSRLYGGADVRQASPGRSDPRRSVGPARIHVQSCSSFLRDRRKETDPIQIIDVNKQVQPSQQTAHLTVKIIRINKAVSSGVLRITECQ